MPAEFVSADANMHTSTGVTLHGVDLVHGINAWSSAWYIVLILWPGM